MVILEHDKTTPAKLFILDVTLCQPLSQTTLTAVFEGYRCLPPPSTGA